MPYELQELAAISGMPGLYRLVRLLKFKKPELPIRASLPVTFKLSKPGSNVTE